MASILPSSTKVAGKHSPIYEAYYRQIDPKGAGNIEAMTAARFLKKSGLSDVVLSRIWDLSDPNGRGFLDKDGFFVALKLVGLAQAGHDINMRNIFLDPPNPPKVGDIPKILPPKIESIPPTSTDWSIKTIDRLKYEELFKSLKPVDGVIPGNNVRRVLMDSKLPVDTLSKIWDLADQDRDGSLNCHEFIVAMHLVYQALDKRAVPSSLPAELLKPSAGGLDTGAIDNGFVAEFPADIGPPPPVPPLPVAAPAIPPMPRVPKVPSVDLLGSPISSGPTGSVFAAMAPPVVPISTDWVVSPADRFDGIFAACDADKDGLVSGLEVRDIFIKSGLPQMCLAQIWALCDTHQTGKLTSEQFALAMWLVERKQAGFEPPDALPPNHVPPSLRRPAVAAISLLGEPLIAAPEPQPTYSNPELEMISKEIEELVRERRLLEAEVDQHEADVRVKSGEVRNLQSELDALVATLKQLENQKGEAQKRLEDLKAQKEEVDASLNNVHLDIEETHDKVTKIREQCQKQEETIRDQEGELDSRRSELQRLKDEEAALEAEHEKNKNELLTLSKSLQETQLQICQIRAMVTQLEENQRQINGALEACKAALEANDPNSVSYYSLNLEMDFREARKALEDKPEPDPFNDKSNGVGANASNEFQTDKFATTFEDNAPIAGGFGGGFDDSFNSGFAAGARGDPFGSKADPFGDTRGAPPAITPDPNKDDFGSDPFAILHAPTTTSQALSPSSSLGQKSGPPPRPESPSPALPPKKAKQPPPRPAPPRPNQGPTFTKANTSGGFADFADFDNKNSNVPDFAEDPFKDYRYEDPFNIQDPFEDNEDPFQITLNNNNSQNGGNEISAKVDAQPKATNNNTARTAPGATTNFANFDEFVTNDTDFFAAFNDNFNKPKPVDAVMDAFGDKSTPASSASDRDFKHTTTLIKANNLKNNNVTKHAFNDDFDDAFGSLRISNNNKAATGNSTKTVDKFEFDDFGADFGKFDVIAATASTNKLKKTKNVNGSSGGAIAKTPNNNDESPAKVTARFAGDYSKTDNQFEDDLQAVLQRSLVDQ